MDKDQIDELFRILTDKYDEKAICELIGLNEDLTRYNNGEITYDEFEKKLMNQMIQLLEQGDFDYFKTKMNSTNENERALAFEIMTMSSRKNEIRDLIDRRETLNIAPQQLCHLIISLGDSNFTKSILEDSNEIKRFRSFEIIDLLKSINNNIDYVYIYNYIMSNLNTYKKGIAELILSVNNIEFTDAILTKKNIDKLGLNDYVLDLIKSHKIPEIPAEEEITDEEIKKIEDERQKVLQYKKEWIKRGKDLGLSESDIVSLIKSINDLEFTDEILTKENLNRLGLGAITKLSLGAFDDNYDVLQIIENHSIPEIPADRKITDEERKKIEDERQKVLKYKKEWIKRGKDLGLSHIDMVKLIVSVNDIEFTDAILTNENINKCGLDNYDVLQIIKNHSIPEIPTNKEITDEEKEKIEDERKKVIEYRQKWIGQGEYLGLTTKDKVSLINDVNDMNFAYTCVERYQELGLEISSILQIIKKFNNNSEIINTFFEHWNGEGSINKDIADLVIGTNNPVYAAKCLNSDSIAYVDGETIFQLLKIADKELSQKVKGSNKIQEILSLEDLGQVRGFVLRNIILNAMHKENANIDAINEEIDKIYDIFLTSNLPDNFKFFEFFKNHRNHEQTNYFFYGDRTDNDARDKTISGDLFRTLLESNNTKMRYFLEILNNGHLALNDTTSNDRLANAILLQYRNVIYDLLDVTEKNTLSPTDDYMQDLTKIREYLKLDEGADIGEELLTKYMEGTGLEYKKDDESLIQSLLKIMDSKREEAQQNNQKPFKLEEGDLIKGTDIIYLKDILENGIRSKEFYMKADLLSDATPLDTDFSEISEDNLHKGSMSEIIDSTYSRSNYGTTYYVIKKSNYEDDEISYSKGIDSKKSRYFRTSIGSTNISAIITSEWNEEYKYLLAKNGFYIPVINMNGKILFTQDEYEKIRESMQGLTHYGLSDFTIDESANDSSIKKEAEILRKDAERKTPTEIKREAVIEFIRENIGKELTTDMIGDISSRYLELIDTGSTGRGTNIPGDGDFDFMLKCANKDEQSETIAKIKTFLQGKDKGGTNEFNIRYTDVKIEGLDELVEVDVTSEQKKLEVDYSSDLAIKDRLSSIKSKYGEEGLQTVIDNIIVAKKILKENGIYKKTNSVRRN